MKIKKRFDSEAESTYTPEYQKLVSRRQTLKAKANCNEGIIKEQAIEGYKEATKKMLKLPAKSSNDKKLKYVRYADDFLIAVNGSRQDCEQLKAELSDFIKEQLKMELSQEKTLITHGNEYARFLSYDIRVRRSQQIKRKNKFKTRSLNNKVELSIPFKEKIEQFLFSHHTVTQRLDNGRLEPCHRKPLINLTDLEIITAYNAEVRGFCNYYSLASSFHKVNYFNYLMEYSCLKTLTNKHRSKISIIRNKFKDGTGAWDIPYETKKGMQRRYFVKYSECKTSNCIDTIPTKTRDLSHYTTTQTA